MAYMTQQAVTTAIRDAFRQRPDALAHADEAARFRAWLISLPLEPQLIASLVEPVAALEDGLRDADRLQRRDHPGP
jgi:hypothetical protein